MALSCKPQAEELEELLLTVMLIALEVLVAYVEEPPYTAVKEKVPELENEVARVAVPEPSVPAPSEVVPS